MTEINDTVTSIAIIGMSGRFPGASDLQEFWENLCRGSECIRSYSAEELASAGVDTKILSHPNFVNAGADRKSTRLNSSHTVISYAVFCLKKKKISKIN